MNQREKNECVFFRIFFTCCCSTYEFAAVHQTLKNFRLIHYVKYKYILNHFRYRKVYFMKLSGRYNVSKNFTNFSTFEFNEILWAILIVKSQQPKNHITSTLIIHFTVYFKLTSSWILINWSVQIREETKKEEKKPKKTNQTVMR